MPASNESYCAAIAFHRLQLVVPFTPLHPTNMFWPDQEGGITGGVGEIQDGKIAPKFNVSIPLQLRSRAQGPGETTVHEPPRPPLSATQTPAQKMQPSIKL